MLSIGLPAAQLGTVANPSCEFQRKPPTYSGLKPPTILTMSPTPAE